MTETGEITTTSMVPGSGSTTPETDNSNQNEKQSLPFSRSHAFLIATCIVSTQFVQMIPYGAGINIALHLGERLGGNAFESAWIAASYPLTQGTFVLMGGRVGTILGHKNTLMAAGAWWVIFTLVSGFTRSIIALCVMRGLAGAGGAFMVPNSLALLTLTFPPGKWRNITVSMFGAMAPIGAAGGSIIPGFFGQLLPWKWLFFFLAMLGTAIFTLFYFVVPSEGPPFDPHGKFDYVGAFLGTGGLILFNFVWNQAPAVGWDEPYEYILLVVSVLLLAAFIIWERSFSSEPILPFDIWKSPSFTPMIFTSLLVFMGVGIVLWYVTVWNITIRGYTMLENSAAYIPLSIGGGLAAVLSGWAIRRVQAEYIMVIGALASCTSLILVATQPAHQIYWAQTFPALLVLALGPDFLFTAAQIIASNSVKRRHQGIAGSLIGTILSYGLSTGLGFAGTVEAHTNDKGRNPVEGFKHALYLGIGFAAMAIVLAVGFVRIPKDQRNGWDEDDAPPGVDAGQTTGS